MAAVTIIAMLDKVVKEELAFVKRASEPEVDGIFKRMYTTSAGVERGGTGRGWIRKHTFPTGLSGHFHNLDPVGGNTLDQSNTGQSNMYATPTRTFPGVTDVTAPNYLQKTIGLVQGMGSFAFPLQVLEANELDAALTDVIGLTIQGVGKKVAQTEANSWYSNNSGPGTVGGTTAVRQNDVFTIADVTGGSFEPVVSGAASPTLVLQFATSAGIFDTAVMTGTIGRLMPGMTLQHRSAAHAAKTATAKVIVSSVDYLARRVTLKTTDAGNFDALADGDYFVPRGSVDGTSGFNWGPSGPASWLKASGTVFGIDLSVYPQFKSLVSAVNNVLDETTLNKHVATFFDAYGAMYGLDTMITRSGVLNAYLENIDGLHRYERFGKTMRLKEGFTSFDYEYDGNQFECLTSRYMERGTAWIMKTKGQNIKRYVPPYISGAGKRSEFNSEIQFWAPLTGSKNIFLPATVSDAHSEFVVAPFYCFREVCPDQIPGIVLTGLEESIL